MTLNRAGEVSDCLLSGDLPCTVSVAGVKRPATVHFDLDLRPQSNPDPNNANLALACEIDGTTYSVADAWFEDGLLRLERTFPTDQELTTCITCLYSDYSPGGHGLTGMQCHRQAKTQYLEVRSKAEYWGVPVTETSPRPTCVASISGVFPGLATGASALEGASENAGSFSDSHDVRRPPHR